ncbi:DUF928 domain-containing protein [Baaleninema simplex]|uniref:DUF928 domain-containing protein n=1 Tax=Baaleninema simplex TaxID=2862350 RepID=UPI00034AA042|nr:DUF928 domain-containing protein [Baaleninema simplex]
MFEQNPNSLYRLLTATLAGTVLFGASTLDGVAKTAKVDVATSQSERANVPDVTFDPPTDETLDDSAGGATRPAALKCRQDPTSEVPLSALVPDRQVGLTLSERPEFFAYVPETHAEAAYFSLKDEDDREIYSREISLAETPGIVRITLPSDVPPLDFDRIYRWQLGILCQPAPTDLPWIEGRVRRVASAVELPPQFDRLSAVERAAWYGEAGLWYDTLSALAGEYTHRPNNTQLLQTWENLLVEVGLDPIASEPLVSF